MVERKVKRVTKKEEEKKLIPSFTVLFAFASIFEQPIIQHMQFEPSNG